MLKEIAPNVYVSTVYPGINIGLVVAGQWVMAIDAPPFPSEHQAWRKALRALGHPIRYLILTDDHPDRLLGALWVGVPIIAGRGTWQKVRERGESLLSALVDDWNRRHAARERVLLASEMERIPVPEIVVQGRITVEDTVPVTVEAIAGPMPGSVWVWLPQQAVLFTGDGVVQSHPAMTEVPSFARWLEVLAGLEEGMPPARIVVPGRGAVGGPEMVRPLVEYLRHAHQRLQAARAKGQRADLAALAEELLPRFPFPEEEKDRTLPQIRAGLDRWWEEIKGEKVR